MNCYKYKIQNTFVVKRQLQDFVNPIQRKQQSQFKSSLSMSQPIQPQQSYIIPAQQELSQIPPSTISPSPLALQIETTSNTLNINSTQINFGNQRIINKQLYIISVPKQSKLKTPLILNRSKKIDSLDRRIFTQGFIQEIVRSLEICIGDDAVFIVKRIPKNIHYFVGLFQKLSLDRWKGLILIDKFFITIYQALSGLVTKQTVSKLRIDMIQQVLGKLIKPYQRIFYIMDSIVLENQAIRNSIISLARDICLEQLNKKTFFNRILLQQTRLQNQTDQSQSQQQNIQNDLNHSVSSIQTLPQDKQMSFPSKLLANTINVIKSCLKIKITNEIVCTTILNVRFFKILKKFYKSFFQKQRYLLLEVLAFCCFYNSHNLWKITFQDGKTIKNKKFLEIMLTQTSIIYSDGLKKQQKSKQKKTKIQKGQNTKNDTKMQDKTLNSWQHSRIIIEKLFQQQTAAKRVLYQKILQVMLKCRLKQQQLLLIMNYLETSYYDQIYLAKNIPFWQSILSLTQEHLAPALHKETLSFPKSHLNKHTLILYLKIYYLFVCYSKRFCLDFNVSIIQYLLNSTDGRKGVIYGVRAKLENICRQFGMVKEDTEIGKDTEIDKHSQIGNNSQIGQSFNHHLTYAQQQSQHTQQQSQHTQQYFQHTQ